MIEGLQDFLNQKVEQFNHIDFIEDDPICIPHELNTKADIEIIGFIVATIAWGNRKSIIKNGYRLLNIMGNEPHNYVLTASPKEIKEIEFVHRTFNRDDLAFFLHAFREIYKNGSSLENLFNIGNSAKERIVSFREKILEQEHLQRSEKHISNPDKGSSAKRINMFLRWMVRKDKKGVDFGLWNTIPMRELMIPLDVHTGNMARKLQLLKRSQNDWKALEELMMHLRKFDPEDPCKYDFALFGLGVTKELEK